MTSMPRFDARVGRGHPAASPSRIPARPLPTLLVYTGLVPFSRRPEGRWGRRRACSIFAIALLALSTTAILAQDAPPQPTTPPDPVEIAPTDGSPPASADDDDDLPTKPTNVGIRFTPRLADAISSQMTRQMKSRYEFSDEQARQCREILSRQFMKLATKNAEAGRDAMEHFIAVAVENEGTFPKDDALKFAKLMKPIFPAMKQFFADSAVQIGKTMDHKQRLKFAGDMAGVTAGVLTFEKRMKDWEGGKIGRNANPFMDNPEGQGSDDDVAPDAEGAQDQEYRRARQGAERSMNWETNVENNWDEYIKNAAEYYQFTPAQTQSADAVLKDCKERALAIKTDQWRAAMLANLVAQRLTRRTSPEFTRGPWMFHLDDEHDRLLQPLNDLSKEFKRRIEELPDSAQRAAAEERVRKQLEEKGWKAQGG